jgi:hypothetical protein
MVYIGMFFPVYLHAYKMLIHEGGRTGVFKTLSLHYMAPMARSIPNTHQYRYIAPGSLGKGFIAPWVPVYGVVCMLLQVWALLV